MQFNFKNYQTKKTETYLKKNNFVLFTIGANQKSSNWTNVEQKLCILELLYYKTYTNAVAKAFQRSVYKNLKKSLINSTLFFLQPKNLHNTRIKGDLIKNLNLIFFSTLAIKLNKKVYSTAQQKKLYSLHYKKNILIMQQFILTNLKTFHTMKK